MPSPFLCNVFVVPVQYNFAVIKNQPQAFSLQDSDAPLISNGFKVIINRFFKPAVFYYPPIFKKNSPLTETLCGLQVMRHKNNGLAFIFYFKHLIHAFALGIEITDGKYVIYQQNIGIDMDCDCKGKTHIHSLGINFNRRVNEFTDSCELDYIIITPRDLFFVETIKG